jgi:hypothetical protein
MMQSEFPSNRQTDRPRNKITEKPEKKNVEKITNTQVVRRKKPLSKRFTEHFMGGDAKSAWGYVAFDVLLPAARDTLADAISQGVERMIFGEARSHSRRTGRRPGGQPYISYNRMSHGSRRLGPSDERYRNQPSISRRGRASHDFDEIILGTRVEAEEVIDRLFDLVSKYESATVADLYDLVGVSRNYTDDKWGWLDLRGAGVTRVHSGYLLDLPKPEPLD